MFIGSCACVKDEKKIWISEYKLGCLFVINTGNYEISHVCINNEYRFGIRISAFKSNNKLFFTNVIGSFISVYNLDSQNYYYIDLISEYIKPDSLFTNAVMIKDKIVFYTNIGISIEVNTNDDSVLIKKNKLSYLYEELSQNDNEIVIRQQDNNIFLIDNKEKKIYHIDIEKNGEGYVSKKLPEWVDDVYSVFFCDGEYWIFQKYKSEVISINWNNEIRKFNGTNNCGVEFPYYRLIKKNEDLWILNYYLDSISVIDKNKMQIVPTINNLEYRRGEDGPGYSDIIEYEDKLIFIPNRGKQLLIFEKGTEIIRNIPIDITSNIVNKIMKAYISTSNDMLVPEREPFCTLSTFLDVVIKDDI